MKKLFLALSFFVSASSFGMQKQKVSCEAFVNNKTGQVGIKVINWHHDTAARLTLPKVTRKELESGVVRFKLASDGEGLFVYHKDDKIALYWHFATRKLLECPAHLVKNLR